MNEQYNQQQYTTKTPTIKIIGLLTRLKKIAGTTAKTKQALKKRKCNNIQKNATTIHPQRRATRQ